ncbi:Uncharacterized protein PBTT_08786 [Plasmodiophora brassicae]
MTRLLSVVAVLMVGMVISVAIAMQPSREDYSPPANSYVDIASDDSDGPQSDALSMREAVLDSGRPFPFNTLVNSRRHMSELADCWVPVPESTSTNLAISTTVLAALIQIGIVQIAIVLLCSANAGGFIAALPRDDRSPPNRALPKLMLSSWASVGASTGVQALAAAIIINVFKTLPRHIARKVACFISRYMQLAGFFAGGMAASAAVGQDIGIGARCGLIYATAMLIPEWWIYYRGKRLSRAGAFISPLWWVDLAMSVSFVFFAVLALLLTVPVPSRKLALIGAVMGLAGLGDIACVADTFAAPTPPLDPK